MSGNSLGYVNSALQLGVQSVAIAPLPRRIFDIVGFNGASQNDIIAQATVEERHEDQMEVTVHPVETGAPITDHAFVRPAHLLLTLMWSNSPPGVRSLDGDLTSLAATQSAAARSVVGAVSAAQAAMTYTSNVQNAGVTSINAAYAALLKLQQTRALFSVITGKRLYKNMICKSLRTETNYKTSNSMSILVECQQIFLVDSAVVPFPAATQANPQDTASYATNGTKALTPAASGAGVLK